MRQSNRIATSAAAQSFREINSEFIGALCANENLVKLYLAGLSGRDTLPTEDRIRFDMVMNQIFRTAESQYLEHQDGHMSAEILDSYFRSFVVIMRQPGARAAWHHRKEELIGRFVRDIEETVLAEAEA